TVGRRHACKALVDAVGRVTRQLQAVSHYHVRHTGAGSYGCDVGRPDVAERLEGLGNPDVGEFGLALRDDATYSVAPDGRSPEVAERDAARHFRVEGDLTLCQARWQSG